MKLGKALPGLVVLAAACISAGAFADNSMHWAQVYFDADSGAVAADVDGTGGMVGELGKPMQFHVKYEVGWYYPPAEGTTGAMTLKESDIDKPEYAALWSDDDHNPSDYPPGMVFSAASGVFSGTPSGAGSWAYYPSVRDKENGEDQYSGNGYWNAQVQKVDGKTWVMAKDATKVVILAPPSAKAIMLQCTGTPNLNLLLQVDYDSGLVRLFGNDGKLAGVYHANISDDFIAWGKTNVPYFTPSSVRLDRKTGTLTTTIDYGTAPTGSCTKRSTEQKF